MSIHLTAYKDTAPKDAVRIRTKYAAYDLTNNVPLAWYNDMTQADYESLCAFIEQSKPEHDAIYFWITQ